MPHSVCHQTVERNPLPKKRANETKRSGPNSTLPWPGQASGLRRFRIVVLRAAPTRAKTSKVSSELRCEAGVLSAFRMRGVERMEYTILGKTGLKEILPIIA